MGGRGASSGISGKVKSMVLNTNHYSQLEM